MATKREARLRLGSDSINWDEFELFCLALLDADPEVESANRFGGPGEKQDGIDIEVRFKDGRPGGVQCRQRRSSFGKSDLDQAVSDYEYEADRHIVMTSAPATVPARKEAQRRDRIELRDIDDLGRMLRSLPRVEARWLAEDALGAAARKAFLGPDGSLSLTTWQQAYSRELDTDEPFTHDIPLIGRHEELDGLLASVRSSPGGISIVPGRGGSGKSRLLIEFARELESAERAVYFLVPGADPSWESLADELPLGDCVLVVDDVHRRGAWEGLLGPSARREDLHLVLSTRPARVAELRSAARLGGFPGADIHTFEDLAPLSPELSSELAHLAADGAEPEIFEAVEDLGRRSRDCQLVTVVGARLLRGGGSRFTSVADAEALREEVLLRFEQELLGRVSDSIERSLARELLGLVAAIQPVRDGGPEVEAMAEQLGVDAPTAGEALDELEVAGLLIRGGGLRRISPDLLADHVLEGRCFTAGGSPSGYSEMLLARFAKSAFANLILNLAELDWRRGGGGGRAKLLDDLWGSETARYRAGNASVRSGEIDLLSRVAILAPGPILEIAEIEIEHPATSYAIDAIGFEISAADLRLRLAPLVRDAGLNISFTRRAMGILWQLGRDDERAERQHLDQPIRLLKELGSYSQSLPHARALLDLARELLQDDDPYPLSPSELLAPLLAREFMTTRTSDRQSFSMSGRFVSAELADSVRRPALDLLREQLIRPGAHSEAAVGVLERARRLPRGYFGDPVPAVVREQWRDEQARVVGLLAAALAAGHAPPLCARLRAALSAEAEDGIWEAPRRRAADALERNPPSLHEELVDVLGDPWRRSGIAESRDGRVRIAGRLTEEIADDAARAKALEAALADAGAQRTPAPFLAALCGLDRDAAAGVLQWLLNNQESPLFSHAEALLPRRRADVPREIFLSEEPRLRRLAAAAFALDPTGLDSAEEHALEGMLRSEDREIRGEATFAVANLATADPDLALSLALRARPRSAEEVDTLIYSLDVGRCSDDDLLVFVGWLDRDEALRNAETEFMVAVAARVPLTLAGVLVRRASEGEHPHELHDLRGLFVDVDDAVYREVFALLVEAAQERTARSSLAWIVPAFARSYDEVLDLLRDDLLGADKDRRDAAVALLEELPSGVLFTSASRIILLLDETPDLDSLRDALMNVVISGAGGMRSHGNPFPGEVDLQMRARAVAADLESGSKAEAFYSHVAETAEGFIARTRDMDEEEDLMP